MTSTLSIGTLGTIGKEIFIGTVSSGISDKLRDIYSICRSYMNVATYKWKVHSGKIEIISFVVYCGIFYFKLKGLCDQQNH